MSQDSLSEQQERRDFFISYAGQDKPWAEWIAAQLDTAGYTFFFQAWDFRPGSNFVVEMDQATKLADRTLLVLSAAYLASGFAFSEWAAAFRQDPTGVYRQILPVRIESCKVEGLLRAVVYIDLVDLEEPEARERLLAGVHTGRAKPVSVVFPGKHLSRALFPGDLPTT
ncbi:MAG: toll/interleukin-1 receptor domain-containing protein [Ktedonobacteraceae bacterium]|nr:toll/interleukin-1 receptor domain-containing protein [Ktedonobacteraceae bacterium]